jgi:hypothetical protein
MEGIGLYIFSRFVSGTFDISRAWCLFVGNMDLFLQSYNFHLRSQILFFHVITITSKIIMFKRIRRINIDLNEVCILYGHDLKYDYRRGLDW